MSTVREVALAGSDSSTDVASFLACMATILELDYDRLPRPREGEDPATDWTVTRWLGGLGVGLVPIADPASFAWPGPWIARVDGGGFGAGGGRAGGRRAVVMFGVPSGVVWDPAAAGGAFERIEDGFVLAATDIALALPARPPAPAGAGTVEAIWVAPSAGAPAVSMPVASAVAGGGLQGDRHLSGTGTFPSGVAGSALTLIEAEVCESFDPPLSPGEHRRNIVTRGIELNKLVGRRFAVGDVRCRGMRLCEPCTVVQHYASRPVLRALVHRGGLRADILADGQLAVGDAVELLD
ncbi:MAG: MOSC domain-containing protein [Solirubrobacteraceae bacterium]|jgi:hypothetical protein